MNFKIVVFMLAYIFCALAAKSEDAFNVPIERQEAKNGDNLEESMLNTVTEKVDTDSTKEELSDSNKQSNENREENKNFNEKVAEDYKTGSICNYCKYCKHCDETVCETKCPCKDTDEKEICETCRYCKYCFVCGSVCDTVCNPGGILDSLTGSLYESFPSFTDKTKEDVDEDIEKAKDFIKEYL